MTMRLRLVIAAGVCALMAATAAPAAAQTCPCGLWTDSTIPGANSHDGSALELGLKFRADTSGYITGIRFYKYSQNTGPHVGNVWTAGGALLGTVTFSGESASGWQLATFPSPIPVAAATTYVASYHTNTGFYAATY